MLDPICPLRRFASGIEGLPGNRFSKIDGECLMLRTEHFVRQVDHFIIHLDTQRFSKISHPVKAGRVLPVKINRYHVTLVLHRFLDKRLLPFQVYNLSLNLNPNYTFETFVIGNNNNLAHAASLAVAETPGEVYNPLFIYGGVGLGKTHLMHAIGNYIIENSNRRVLYVTSDQFRDDFVGINKKDEKGTNFSYIDFFKNKYRNIDVLLIDDIQFIAGKERIQEEFFHTFNTLYENGKQIIISSDKPPREIQFLEDRLKSRFEWGLLADISCPDYGLTDGDYKTFQKWKSDVNSKQPVLIKDIVGNVWFGAITSHTYTPDDSGNYKTYTIKIDFVQTRDMYADNQTRTRIMTD